MSIQTEQPPMSTTITSETIDSSKSPREEAFSQGGGIDTFPCKLQSAFRKHARPTIDNGFYRVSKRVLDIFGALTGLVLLSPIMLLAALAVKFTDGGTIFFCQQRVGRNGKPFKMYKFRSMVPNADSMKASMIDRNEHGDNRTFKILNDPRITRVGRTMRRLSIDELPQLLNVLRGDMSLVGPRPSITSEVELYEPADYQRLSVKPGITCIWQVSGRSNLEFGDQLRLDLEYIESRAFLLDLKLIVLTFPAVFRGEGAA
ncbi:MAG: sugar transferase [Planctomycetales bacterium]|nr:sugar transferase [Planctomycetales bacterium]